MHDGTAPDTTSASDDDGDLLDAYSRAVVDTVDRIMPAVVSLRVHHSRARGPSGQGSGLIIAPDGYVLTNSHVVQRARQVVTVFVDGTQAEGRVVGDDPATDLALVRVHGGHALAHASLSTGTKPRPGHLAVAIGNPLGFDATVSTGVISALGRSLSGPNGQLIEDVIQHTAPLNPGNSGGPLVGARGRVLGINSAVAGRSQGIGFAIPIETAIWVVSELLARGRVRRAYLGISVQTIPLASRRKVHESGSPQARTGLELADASALHRALRHIAIGSPHTLRVLRGAKELTVDITPSETPG